MDDGLPRDAGGGGRRATATASSSSRSAATCAADVERLARDRRGARPQRGAYQARSTATSSTTDVDEVLGAVAARCAPTPRLKRLAASILFIEQPIKRSRRSPATSPSWPSGEAGDHRRVGGYARGLPARAAPGLHRRVVQDLQGPLQVDSQRRALPAVEPRGGRGALLHVGRGSHHPGRARAAAGPGAGVAARPRRTSSATAITT